MTRPPLGSYQDALQVSERFLGRDAVAFSKCSEKVYVALSGYRA